MTLYSLEGMAGVGKTILAAHLAYRLRPHFFDGILWAQLDTSDTMEILSAFAEAYNRDPSFYAFMRSLETYEKTVDSKTTFILTTDSDLLRYMKNAP